MKKVLSILAGMVLVAGLAFAQADDDFYIALDEDFSSSASDGTGGGTGGGSNSSVKQGLWIELTSKSGALIRDLATGTEEGYEFDNQHIQGKVNWWFWGPVNSWFHLDAEVGVFKFDKTLYQANSYGANVPDVTWGDGLQQLLAMPFSFVKEGNSDTAGAFNKFAFNITTPAVIGRVGYGDLRDNGMTEFTGIYRVIDRWRNVGNGYTELKNGSLFSEFGDVRINMLAALSEMRGNYGTYDFIDVNWADRLEVALTYGSYTTADKLFYYFDNHRSAFTGYAKYNILEGLSAEVHGVESYTSETSMGISTGAIAGRISFANEILSLSLMQGFAGKNAITVWGADGQTYDTLLAGKATTMLYFSMPISFVTIGLDEMATLDGLDTDLDGLWRFRTQPMIDFDLDGLMGMGANISTYAVLNIDRLGDATSKDNDMVLSIDSFGLEFKLANVAEYLKKLTFDYAASFEYADWKSGNSYDLNHMINSIMVTAQITDNINVHVGSLIRTDSTSDKTYVPFGFSFGASIYKTPLPGHPMFWAHFAYGMNPYEDNNYTMYRADDPINKPLHRTYMLNSTYKDYTKSEIAFGLIWDLK